MDERKEQGGSHLFLLRLWADAGGEEPGDWSARLQHVFSGETHTFQACPQLVSVLLELTGSSGNGTEQREKVISEQRCALVTEGPGGTRQ